MSRKDSVVGTTS